jgi:hypothetical protein
MADQFPAGDSEEISSIDVAAFVPKKCQGRKFSGAPVGCCVSDVGNLTASANGVLMDLEPYRIWWMSVIEKYELLQLYFALVKQAHQLGTGARAANRRPWKEVWAVSQHNLSDWDEQQDASADPAVLMTDDFIRGLEHSP